MTVQIAGLAQTRWHRFLSGLFARDLSEGYGKDADVGAEFRQSYENVTGLLADVSALLAARQFDEARWALVQLRHELNSMKEEGTAIAGVLDDYKRADEEAVNNEAPEDAEERATRTDLVKHLHRLQHRLEAARDQKDQRDMADSVLFAVLAVFAQHQGLSAPEDRTAEGWALWFSQFPVRA